MVAERILLEKSVLSMSCPMYDKAPNINYERELLACQVDGRFHEIGEKLLLQLGHLGMILSLPSSGCGPTLTRRYVRENAISTASPSTES